VSASCSRGVAALTSSLQEFNANFTSVGQRQSYIKSGFIPAGGLDEDVADIFESFMVRLQLQLWCYGSVASLMRTVTGCGPAMLQASSPSPNSTILWTHSGGAVNRVDRLATVRAALAFLHCRQSCCPLNSLQAFPHRQSEFMCTSVSMPSAALPSSY
jgi:hypothetical protein